MRIAKSFTLDPEVSEYVASTKGEPSASERGNGLLRRAMSQEKRGRLRRRKSFLPLRTAMAARERGRHPALGTVFPETPARIEEQVQTSLGFIRTQSP